jgi:hypothetical protein
MRAPAIVPGIAARVRGIDQEALMRSHFPAVLTALTLAALTVTDGPAVADERSGKLQCAARDAELIVAIEDAGEARSMPDEKVAEAWTMLLEARHLCMSGRVEDGLALYNNIAVAPVQSAKR